jgi:hypothetical protein
VYGIWGTSVLVDALVERGANNGMADAQGAIDSLANLPDDVSGGARHLAAAAARPSCPSRR